MSVTEVLEKVRALSDDQWERVKASLGNVSDEPSDSEDRARQTLMQAGLLKRRQPRSKRSAARSSAPVEIKGEPLSETIIEERR